MIQPKRIHEFATASSGELASSPIWTEIEVPDGSGGFRNRKTPFTGGAGDATQSVAASTATTVVDLSKGNIVFVSVTANTEISLTNIAHSKKYTFIFSTPAPTKTVTFDPTQFNGANGEGVPSVVLTATLTAEQVKIVDFIGTNTTLAVSERSRNQAASGGSGSGQIIDCGARIGSGGERIICGTRV